MSKNIGLGAMSKGKPKGSHKKSFCLDSVQRGEGGVFGETKLMRHFFFIVMFGHFAIHPGADA